MGKVIRMTKAEITALKKKDARNARARARRRHARADAQDITDFRGAAEPLAPGESMKSLLEHAAQPQASLEELLEHRDQTINDLSGKIIDLQTQLGQIRSDPTRMNPSQFAIGSRVFAARPGITGGTVFLPGVVTGLIFMPAGLHYMVYSESGNSSYVAHDVTFRQDDPRTMFDTEATILADLRAVTGL